MRRVIAGVLCSLAAACAFAQQPAPAAIDAGRAAAQQWMSVVDHGNYAASWDASARVFQSAVSKADWEKAVAAARIPFGAVDKREQLAATYAEQLPGSPPGQYVVMQFRAQFAGGKTATETVTSMHEADGTWRVVGYYIK